MSHTLVTMLLSICIPAFNQAPELKKTLTSLGSKSITRAIDDGLIEVLVSNNASTDDTSLLSIPAPRQRPIWFHQAVNLGFRGNLKFLAQHSKSDYLIFLGCGELIDESKFEGLLKLLAARKWSLGTVGLRYFDATAGELSKPSSSALSTRLKSIAPRPLYTEAISGNVFSRELFVNALSTTNQTGDSWPHLEVALRIGQTQRQSSFFRYLPPLVTVHGSSNGWWTRPDSWRLTVSHIRLLNSADNGNAPGWVKIKMLMLMSSGLYGAIRQSARTMKAPIRADFSLFELALGKNPVGWVTLQLLRLQGFLALNKD